jgi:hypothetical protein
LNAEMVKAPRRPIVGQLEDNGMAVIGGTPVGEFAALMRGRHRARGAIIKAAASSRSRSALFADALSVPAAGDGDLRSPPASEGTLFCWNGSPRRGT